MRFSVDYDRKIVDVDADELHFGRSLNERKDIESVYPSNTNDLLVTLIVPLASFRRSRQQVPQPAPSLMVFTPKNHRRDRYDLNRVRPLVCQRRFVIDPILNLSAVE